LPRMTGCVTMGPCGIMPFSTWAWGGTMAELVLPLGAIDPDDAYDLSFPHLPDRAAGMEARFPGLPLLVVDRARRVVCGHDLLLLLRQRGEIRARALQVDLEPAAALLLNYNILNTLFGLNLYEKLLFVKKISPYCSLEEIRRRAEPDFTLDEFLLQMLGILLAEPFRTCLASGRVGLRAALKIADLAEEDRSEMLGLLRSCKFSESQQQLLVQLLEEIAFREKHALARILDTSGVRQALAGEMPQKKILAAVQNLRYPELARAEKEWESWQKKMAADNVSLAHAPLFARGEVKVTLTLKNRSQAEKMLAKLKKTV
jgi:hypothetical protein